MLSQYLRWDLNPHAIAMDFESITSTIPSRRYCFWAKGDLNPWGSHPMVFKTIAIDRSAICHKQHNPNYLIDLDRTRTCSFQILNMICLPIPSQGHCSELDLNQHRTRYERDALPLSYRKRKLT
jgi:hypothetical protein